jgi:hypothetical protein
MNKHVFPFLSQCMCILTVTILLLLLLKTRGSASLVDLSEGWIEQLNQNLHNFLDRGVKYVYEVDAEDRLADTVIAALLVDDRFTVVVDEANSQWLITLSKESMCGHMQTLIEKAVRANFRRSGLPLIFFTNEEKDIAWCPDVLHRITVSGGYEVTRDPSELERRIESLLGVQWTIEPVNRRNRLPATERDPLGRIRFTRSIITPTSLAC